MGYYIHLSQRRRHLIRKGTGHDHNIGLAGGGAEDYTHAVLVVAGSGKMHHLDSAASETEGHGPEG